MHSNERNTEDVAAWYCGSDPCATFFMASVKQTNEQLALDHWEKPTTKNQDLLIIGLLQWAQYRDPTVEENDWLCLNNWQQLHLW